MLSSIFVSFWPSVSAQVALASGLRKDVSEGFISDSTAAPDDLCHVVEYMAGCWHAVASVHFDPSPLMMRYEIETRRVCSFNK